MCGGRRPVSISADGFNDNRLDRHIGVAGVIAGGYVRDGVDDVHSCGHLAEDCVAKITSAMIEEVVVAQIDKELCCNWLKS